MGENTIFMQAHIGQDGSTQIRSCFSACEYYLGKTCKHMLVALQSTRNVHCDKEWWGLFSGPHENRFLAGYPAAGQGPYATLEEAQAASLNNVAAGGVTREPNGQYTVRMGTTLLSSSEEASWVKLQDWTMDKSLGIPKLPGYRSGCLEYVGATSKEDVVCQCTEYVPSRCIACDAGKYTFSNGTQSSSCSMCPAVAATSDAGTSSCKCNAGYTIRGDVDLGTNNSGVSSWSGFEQLDTQYQPTFIQAGPSGGGFVRFESAKKQYLYNWKKKFHISSREGFTVVAVVRFLGTPVPSERIIDMGHGTILLARVHTSANLMLQMQPDHDIRNNSSVYFRTSCGTWDAARAECQANGGDLVVIHGEAKNAAVAAYIKSFSDWGSSCDGSYPWIGASNCTVAGQKCTWIDGTAWGRTYDFLFNGCPRGGTWSANKA